CIVIVRIVDDSPTSLYHMNIITFVAFCLCIHLIGINAVAIPAAPTSKPVNTDTKKNESLSFKEKIMDMYNHWVNQDEYNPPKDSEFYERFWLLFKHCFMNSKKLAKIIPFIG
ncbi:hypothetical protein EWB00_007523, partial [Schistosoma japonicum]